MTPNRYTRDDAVRALEATVLAFETFDAARGALSVGQLGCFAEAIDAFEDARYDVAIVSAQASLLPTCVPKERDGALELAVLVGRFQALQRPPS